MNDLSLFSGDLFAEMDRLRSQLLQAFELSPSIRGPARRYPALNVGSTPESAEIYAFAPGLDPASIEVQVERGVLSISGERPSALPRQGEAATVHMKERFSGKFHRVVTLAEDLDPDAVRATYRDGVLHVSIRRRGEAKPRRINVE
jgi:HSP20 family protein